tara:strand:+ start:12329 stop:12502 length:174 start_codon:yes stop_codon:yes gene_type:complete
MVRYKIIRQRYNGNNTTVKKGLTLEEAQAHCRNPETSGSTCSDMKKRGMWFDSYTEE